MIDIHSHILNNVDDGSDSIERSLKILQEAEEAGFTDIICTPHYIEDYYDGSERYIAEQINKLKKYIYKESISVATHQGNEIYVSNNMCDLIKRNRATTLAKSRYVLFELPMDNQVLYIENIIYSLKKQGFIPIIAHPERYSYVQENPNQLIDLINSGVLFQCNFGSITGQYGKDAKETVKKLLKNNMVHFLASDTHKRGYVYENIDKILDELRKIIDEKRINELTKVNPEYVIRNEEIQVEEPIRIKPKKNFLFW